MSKKLKSILSEADIANLKAVAEDPSYNLTAEESDRLYYAGVTDYNFQSGLELLTDFGKEFLKKYEEK